MENEDPNRLQTSVGASERIFLFSFNLHRAAMLDFSTSVGCIAYCIMIDPLT